MLIRPNCGIGDAEQHRAMAQVLLGIATANAPIAASTRPKGFTVSVGDKARTMNLGLYGVMFPGSSFNGEAVIDVPKLLADLDGREFMGADGITQIDATLMSPGGLLDYGTALADRFTALRREGVKINVKGEGLVASAAVLPFVAADTSSMEAGGRLMTHAPWMLSFGAFDAHDFENDGHIANMRDTLTVALNSYRASLAAGGITTANVKTMTAKGDHFFTAEQGKGNGLIGTREALTTNTEASSRAAAVLRAFTQSRPAS